MPIISNYDGCIIRSKFFIDSEFLDHATKLKFIGRVGSGMESIDVKAAEARGIVCLNSPEGNRDAVAEHAIGMLCHFLTICANPTQRLEQENGLGRKPRIELGSKTVGIIGFGNVGTAFAEKLSGFRCKILAYDKYKTNYAPDYVQEVDFDTICKQADVISFHVSSHLKLNIWQTNTFSTIVKMGHI